MHVSLTSEKIKIIFTEFTHVCVSVYVKDTPKELCPGKII